MNLISVHCFIVKLVYKKGGSVCFHVDAVFYQRNKLLAIVIEKSKFLMKKIEIKLKKGGWGFWFALSEFSAFEVCYKCLC